MAKMLLPCTMVQMALQLLIVPSLGLLPEGNRDIETSLVDKLDGCEGIFIDAGANIGMHARFLFEPSLYPNSTFHHVYNTQFGTKRDNVCALEFEPNPAHRQRIQKLSVAYAAHGWRVIYAPYGISDVRGHITFYHNDGRNNSHEEWGFSVIPHSSASRPVVVPTIDFARFLLLLAQRDKLVGGASQPPRRVVVKMDLEGAEFTVLPHLVEFGVLCAAVDYIAVEFHDWFAPIHLEARDEWHPALDLPSRAAAAWYAQRLRERIEADGRRKMPPCRTRRIVDKDDEAYLYDRSPSQLVDPHVSMAPVRTRGNGT